jgi:Ca-activated chloride channel homolog
MKRIGSVGIWVIAGLQLGCNGCSGASSTQSVVAVPDRGSPQPDPRTQTISVADPREVPVAEQGHVFRPVTHPPHTFASYRAIPESTLPHLVQRSCFAAERPYPTPYQPYNHQAKRAPSPNTYGGGYAPKSAPAPSKPATAPSGGNLGRASASGSGEGRGAGSLSDGYAAAEKKAEAPAAASPPPPPSPPREAVADQSAAELSRPERARQPSPRPEPDDKGSAARRPATEPELPKQVARDSYHDWGASLYLSNDDTMSLSSAQRVLYAIDRQMAVPPDHIRPHEFLNYFSFDTAPVASGDDFSVFANIAPKPGADGIYSLGLSVSGREVTRETRRNAGLTLVIDRSGSMADEGRMDYLKQGLQRMTSELKNGDLVNLVLFDDSVCTPLENFVVGRDSMALLERSIAQLQPRGSTDLNAGLTHGYRLANQAYNDAFTNRVVLISDAIANTGVTDPEMISMISESYDKRRIRLSGVGVGRDFNDELLDRLTEKGKGAYVFLGSSAEVDAVFGARFTSLIETVANDVHFRLHLPPSLRMNTFYGEESSVVKSDVQAIHYFAGTNQLFLSDVMAKNGNVNVRDDIMLTVEYENPETGAAQVEEFAFNLGDISGASHNLDKGRMLMSFIDGLKDIELSQREYSHDANYAAQQCANGKESLRDQADRLRRDPEVDRVVGLWQQYCARYPEPRPIARLPKPEPRESGAVHRQTPRGNDVWPGAR